MEKHSPASFERVYHIREGLAVFSSQGKDGLINMQGTIVLPAIYGAMAPPDKGWCLVEKDNRIYFVDIHGKTVFDPKDRGDIGWEFSEGLRA